MGQIEFIFFRHVFSHCAIPLARDHVALDRDFRCKCSAEKDDEKCDDDDRNLAVCASCNTGYHLVDGECLDNMCSCELGTPKSNEECLFEGAVDCSECNSGWHLESKNQPLPEFYRDKPEFQGQDEILTDQCKVNVCECKFGDAYLHEDLSNIKLPDPDDPTNFLLKSNCDAHQNHTCKSCDSGYTKLREENGYKVLPDGTYATQFLNKTLKREHYGDEQCRLNQCICQNGTAKVDIVDSEGFILSDTLLCLTHNANICAECDDYFHLDGAFGEEECVENKCTCENGVAVTRAPLDGSHPICVQ